jgi:hypothetical protein
MSTYTRWKNAHPRDYKISDVEMLKFMLSLLVFMPSAPILFVWALRDGWKLLRRGRVLYAFTFVAFVPLVALGETPHYFKSWWNRITG